MDRILFVFCCASWLAGMAQEAFGMRRFPVGRDALQGL
jgi:hypothetical protein